MSERRICNRRQAPIDRRSTDRREEPRKDLGLEIRFLRVGNPASQVLHGELLDASVGGFQILFDDHLLPGDRILVEVNYDCERYLSVSAQVIWVEEDSADRQRVGCELSVDLTPKQHKLLRQFATEPRG